MRIRGGKGVIDLAKDPLIDLRVRVCIGGSELRVRFDLPEQKRAANLGLDAEGALAHVAVMGLNLAAGVWLLCAPFMLEFGSPVASVNSIAVGAFVAFLAASALSLDKKVRHRVH